MTTTEHYWRRLHAGHSVGNFCRTVTCSQGRQATQLPGRDSVVADAREHQKDHLLTMLRTWARINRGDPTVPELARRRFENFRDRLEQDGQVVDYGATEGFHLVPRRRGIDHGLIRKPGD